MNFGKLLEFAMCPYPFSMFAMAICHGFDKFLLKISIPLLQSH